MAELFTLENLMTVFLLILLQSVLGFDNLLYISLESKKAPSDKQAYVRKIGIAIAIVLKYILLFVLMSVIKKFQEPIFHFEGFVDGTFNIHALIVILGGVFIIYTAIKEIWHMMTLDHHTENEAVQGEGGKKTTGAVIGMIVFMNLVFSFDSILSAMALSDNFWVIAVAITVSGVLMVYMSGAVSKFLQKNRMYEVLGLFILFVVGIMLLTEGGHLAHMHILGEPITPMTKTTFYFVLFVLVLTDIVQTQYQKRLSKKIDSDL